MRPVAWTLDKPILHRVEVDVIDVRLEVIFVSDHMLPIAALPDVALAFADTAYIRLGAGRRRKAFGESRFDEPNAR